MQNSVELKLRKTVAKLAYKETEKISVSALCKKADISRASFYLYYKDIDDLTEKNREYIINKLDEQMNIIFDIQYASREGKCRIVFTDDDRALLKGFIGKNVYWDFAVAANRIITPRFNKKMIERYGENYYNENKEKFEFILNGSMASLCLDLLNYNEETLIKNMQRITKIADEIFER